MYVSRCSHLDNCYSLVLTIEKVPDVFQEKITEMLDDVEAITTVGDIKDFPHTKLSIAYVYVFFFTFCVVSQLTWDLYQRGACVKCYTGTSTWFQDRGYKFYIV